MKKIVFMAVAIAAVSFASCGNKTAEASATDSAVAALDSTVDSVAAAAVDSVDSVAAGAVAAVDSAVAAPAAQ